MTKEDLKKVYDTLLSMPGMNEQIKIDFKIDRKTVLLLSRVIEKGLAENQAGEENYGLIDAINKESLVALKALATEALEKAGMTEVSGKLNALSLNE